MMGLGLSRILSLPGSKFLYVTITFSCFLIVNLLIVSILQSRLREHPIFPEVVDYLRTVAPPLSGVPSEWPDYLRWAMVDLPRTWSSMANEMISAQSIMGNLLNALTRADQTYAFLGQVTFQLDRDQQ